LVKSGETVSPENVKISVQKSEYDILFEQDETNNDDAGKSILEFTFKEITLDVAKKD
jgi:hypothetical protein